MNLFTSDMHLGHENAIEFDNRPFESVEDMTHWMIQLWNAKVQPKDSVYMLGDIFWKMDVTDAAKIMDKLNGKKFLVKGNHDQLATKSGVAEKFEAIYDYKEITVRTRDGINRTVVLSHFPILCYKNSRRQAIMLHGHLHNSEEHELLQQAVAMMNAKGSRNVLYNVGCMHFGYAPATLDEIIDHYGGLV